MMRCFPACFRASKQQKYHKSLNAIPSQHQSNKATEAVPSTEYINQEKAVKPITGSKAEVKEELNNDFKKRVIFDLNVEAKEEPSYKEVDNSSNLVENNEENKERNRKVVEPILDFIASSKTASFTLNHRYQDCRDSVDEYEDIGLIQVSDLDEDDDDDDVEDKQLVVQEESSESLFSLSIDSRKHVSDAEIGEKEVSSPMPVDKVVKTTESCPNARNRSQYVHSVLNPIENLSQWKELQEGSKPSPPPLKKHYQGKENSSLDQYISISFSISPEPSFKLSDPNLKMRPRALKPVEHEIGVETSLSSWLVESETTPKSNGSNNSVENFRSGKENTAAKSHEDRPILGAWTVEELKQFSTSSSPRRLRSQSPDETPIIGTVGSYWIHTGQKLDYSDSSSSCGGTPITPARDIETIEGKGVSSKPIPFEARLERACDMGVSEA